MSRNNASGNWSNRLQATKFRQIAGPERKPKNFKSFGYVFKNMGDGILKTPLGTRILMGANVERTQRICDDWSIENLELGDKK